MMTCLRTKVAYGTAFFLSETLHVHQTLRSRPARRHGCDLLGGVYGRCAIEGETIAAVGRGLPTGANEIDARGKLVLPGGIDSHAHIEQVSAPVFSMPTRSKARQSRRRSGGTTTVISFAATYRLKLDEVVDAYHALARRPGDRLCLPHDHRRSDRGDPQDNIPMLVKAGQATIKVS